MIQVQGSNTYIDIEIDGQKLTEDFVRQANIEIFAFKIALTAGFAAPTVNIILGTTDSGYASKFKEVNNARVYIGTGPNNLESFQFEIVGRDIKPDPQSALFIVHTGGVITRNNFNTLFLKDVVDGYYEGTALNVLADCWRKELGTLVDSNFARTEDLPRTYKKNQRTLQNFLVDVFIHMDLRPSFPLATIDKGCNLILRDFRTLKNQGPVHTFVPMTAAKKEEEIGYIGKPDTVSYKTYVNRFCGYEQLTGFNTDTGKTETHATSIINDAEGWNLNKLATTMANENNPIEHRVTEQTGVTVSEVTPPSYYVSAMFNKDNLINMSAIQTKITIKGQYLPNVKVLDLVQLNTKVAEDKTAGLYLIEALEIGFVQGDNFTTVVWMCRDNYNDVENTESKAFKLLDFSKLQIPAAQKATIINATRNSRRALVHARNIIDDTYMNEWERQLISMRTATLTNFGLFGTSISFNDTASFASSLRNLGNILANKLIDKFIAPPFNRGLYNFLTGSASQVQLVLSSIATIVGLDLYSELNLLVSDLIMFDQFLDNYITTTSNEAGRVAVSSGNASQPASSISSANATEISFVEQPDGTLTYIADNTTTGDSEVVTTEQKAQIVIDIVAEITENIPEEVDLPIPEIELSDSDAIKPTEEIKEIIVNDITDSLIDKGYVYDSDVVDAAVEAGETVEVVKPDGTVITGQEAQDTMLSSQRMKEILSGTVAFDSVASTKIQRTVGTDLKVRFWGTFDTEDDLLTFKIIKGFTDKYRTVNATKRLHVRGGKRVFVALPASETNVRFYINSNRVTMNEMDIPDLGYYGLFNKPIPYIIYYTTEGYNSNNVVIELRKGT